MHQCVSSEVGRFVGTREGADAENRGEEDRRWNIDFSHHRENLSLISINSSISWLGMALGGIVG